MSYTTPNWARRTVKNGRVLIGGVYYYPRGMYDTIPYDERFEGKTLLFGRYNTQCGHGLVYEPHVYLHPEDHHSNVVNGEIHWSDWWADVDTMIQLIDTVPQNSGYAHRLRVAILRFKKINLDNIPRTGGNWGVSVRYAFDKWLKTYNQEQQS